MAYDKKQIYKDALKQSEDPDVYFVSDIVDLLGISKTTFYEFFPSESEEMNTFTANLRKNKGKTKAELRLKLKSGDKASEILALYRLIGTTEERKKLSSSFLDITTDGKSINNQAPVQINFFSTKEEE